ncbi:MAG: alginate export family protein, partial [Nitrospirae bacterium]|nr:alginate export family protein [Nitrospirota bacterium]
MRTSFRINFLAALIMMIGIGGTPAHAALDTEKLTIGGEIRERGEFRTNADFNNNADDGLSFIGSRAPEISFFFQMQDFRVFGSEFSTASNEQNLDLHQGYLMVKNLIGPASLTLGRQEMVFGDSRLIGNFGWSNVGRSFDGLRFAYLKDALRIDLFGMTIKKGTYAAIPAVDPPATTANQDGQHLYGIYASLKASGMTIEPYLLLLQDSRPATGAITDAAANGQTRETLGVRVDKKGEGNPLDFTAELAYQTGTMDPRGVTPKSNIQAYALA